MLAESARMGERGVLIDVPSRRLPGSETLAWMSEALASTNGAAVAGGPSPRGPNCEPLAAQMQQVEPRGGLTRINA